MNDSKVRPWSFYDPATGSFTGRTYSGPGTLLAVNTPSGHKAVEGYHDHLSKRVDLESGQVVDWQPPQPTPDHEWDAEARRWTLSAATQERQAARANALARIAALEQQQLRPLRELALGMPGAIERVREIELQIAGLRRQVQSAW